MYGLCNVHIELTSKCNKNCWMCGRRKIDRKYPDIAMNYGDMDFELVEKLADELPQGITVQFHNNGEPLLYPRFGDAIAQFAGKTRCITTNGKLLIEKKDELLELDSISVSVIEKDTEAREQYTILYEFFKERFRPLVIIRFVGNSEYREAYTELAENYDRVITTQRTLHDPMGSHAYRKSPVIPETGICREMLHCLAIDKDGNVSPCVRFDPIKKSILGNVKKQSLISIWNSDLRRKKVQYHMQGRRDMVPLCAECEYWGVPTSD